MQPVIQALRDWLDGQPQRVHIPSASFRRAGAHRLNGTLYHIEAVLGDADSRRCESAWATNIARHFERISLLAAEWPAEAPPPLVYKGADLVENVFDDPGARQSVDLDLMLPAPYFEPVAAQLERRADQVTVPAYERHPHERPYAYGYRFGDLLIELHQDPQPPHRCALTGHDVWTRGTPGALGRTAVRYPTPLDRTLLWLSNQAKGAFYGDLSDLVDLALLLQRTPGTWRALRASAREVGLERPLHLALVRLRTSGLWSGPLPQVPAMAEQVARLLPPVEVAQIQPPQLRFQSIKWWLCTAKARREVALRGLSSVRSHASN